MMVLGVVTGLLTLGVGVALATGLGWLGLRIVNWMDDRGSWGFGSMFWMGYGFSVVIPAFFGAFAVAFLVGAWVSSL